VLSVSSTTADVLRNHLFEKRAARALEVEWLGGLAHGQGPDGRGAVVDPRDLGTRLIARDVALAQRARRGCAGLEGTLPGDSKERSVLVMSCGYPPTGFTHCAGSSPRGLRRSLLSLAATTAQFLYAAPSHRVCIISGVCQ
jgi:hypothetical protein